MITKNDLAAIGSFSSAEKKAASGAMTGALGGAGLGLLVQALRPKDKDQNQLKEYLLSALTGAGLGTAAGFAYDNWNSSSFDPGAGKQQPEEDTIRIPVPDSVKPVVSEDGTTVETPDVSSKREIPSPERLEYLAAVATASHEKHPDSTPWTEAAMIAQDRGVTLRGSDGKPVAGVPFYITREVVDGIIPQQIAGREAVARRLYDASDRNEIGYRNNNGTIFQMVSVPVPWSDDPVLMPDTDKVLFREEDTGTFNTLGFQVGNAARDYKGDALRGLRRLFTFGKIR